MRIDVNSANILRIFGCVGCLLLVKGLPKDGEGNCEKMDMAQLH